MGKGLASAALGALLQARGYGVRLRKLDPYLNVDPGTMSPYQHGEVFVTDEFGAYVDQTVTVTINGTNDVPVVSNLPAAAAGAVTEAGNLDDGTLVPGTASIGGTLSATDVDANATQTWSLQGAPSTTYGSIALDPTSGVWTYTLDNTLAATQALAEGDVVTETFTARVTDEYEQKLFRREKKPCPSY